MRVPRLSSSPSLLSLGAVLVFALGCPEAKFQDAGVFDAAARRDAAPADSGPTADAGPSVDGGFVDAGMALDATVPDAGPPPCLGSAGPEDQAPPAPTIVFPLEGTRTLSGRVRVRGRTTDDGRICALSVNGVPVDSEDGFASWTVELPATPGPLTLVATATDAAGRIGRSAPVTLSTASALPQRPMGAAHVTIAGRVEVVTTDNAGDGRLLAFDVAASTVRPVLPGPAGEGVFFETVARDDATHVLAAANGTELLRVDVEAGRFEMVSGLARGSGPLPSSQRAIAASATVAWVLDADAPAIFEIDLATGDRRVLSGSSSSGEVGAGPELSDPRGLVWDPAGGRLIVALHRDGRFAAVSVALSTGDRALFSGAKLGGGPMDFSVTGMDADPAERRAFMSVFGGPLVALDLTSGGRDWLSLGEEVGSGPDVSQPIGVSVDLSGGRAYLAEPSAQGVVVVALDTGARQRVRDEGLGQGPRPSFAAGLAVDAAARTAWLVDARFGAGAVIAYDLDTRDRRLVSDNDSISGDDVRLGSLIGVTTSPDPELLYAVDAVDGLIVSVSRSTGARTPVSAPPGASWPETGTGPAPMSPTGIAWHGPSGRLVVLDALGVLAVDPMSGDRIRLSGGAAGQGPAFGLPLGLTVTSSGTIYVGDAQLNAVLEVDAASGDRSLVSGMGRGAGEPIFIGPYALAVAPGGALYASGDAWLWRIDPSTGDRGLVGLAQGPGPRADPLGLFVLEEPYVFATVGTRNALMVLDGLDGASVIWSQ